MRHVCPYKESSHLCTFECTFPAFVLLNTLTEQGTSSWRLHGPLGFLYHYRHQAELHFEEPVLYVAPNVTARIFMDDDLR